MCLKIPYLSRADAKRRAHNAGQYFYRCPHCGYWHLSSMTKREYKREVKRGRGAP